jgi:hypothetical protein
MYSSLLLACLSMIRESCTPIRPSTAVYCSQVLASCVFCNKFMIHVLILCIADSPDKIIDQLCTTISFCIKAIKHENKNKEVKA